MKSLAAFIIYPGALLSFFGCQTGHREFDEQMGQNLRNPDRSVVAFYRQFEPNEKAFTFLLPEGWTIAGGITRVADNIRKNSAQPEELQLYMKLSSPDTKAGFGWLPDRKFFDRCHYSGENHQTNQTPPGSMYNGMPVMSKTSPVDFVRLIAIPFAHPHARQVNITSVQTISGPSLHSSANRPVLLPDTEPTSESAVVTFEYLENNIRFTEKMVCVIEDHGIRESGIWGNKETFFMRAEKDLFTSMTPLFVTINQSIKPGNQTEERAGVGNIVQGNVIYLSLTELADYINPFTGETEYGCSEWKYRWINCQGDMVCSNDPSYDPERDASLRLKGFKRSEPGKHSK